MNSLVQPLDADIHPDLKKLIAAFDSEIERHENAVAQCNVVDETEVNTDEQNYYTQSAEPTTSFGIKSPPKSSQSMFLVAALQMMDATHIESRPVSSSGNSGKTGMSKPLVLPTDTLLAGYLKKSKDTPIPLFTQKYVVLTNGSLTYYQEGGKDGEGLKKKTVELDTERCTCRAVTSNRFHNKYVFEIIQQDKKDDAAKANKRLWMTKTADERDIWMRAIHTAMKHPSASSMSKANRGTIMDESDVQQYLETQLQIRAAARKVEYERALRNVGQDGIALPIEWIHQQKASSPKNNSSSSSSMEQIFKDMSRDTIEVNGMLYKGAECGPEAIIGAIMQKCMEVCTTSSPGLRMTESDALRMTRDVLVASNRTQSGGDSYDAVNMLCQNPDLIVLCPSGTESEPLRITVEAVRVSQGNDEEECLKSDDDDENQESEIRSSPASVISSSSSAWADRLSPKKKNNQNKNSLSSRMKAAAAASTRRTSKKQILRNSRFQLQVRVEALSRYKVCDANPQGYGSDTWAEVNAEFRQTFSFASFYGAVADSGILQIDTKILTS